MASTNTIFHSAYRLQSIVEILSSHGNRSGVNMSVFMPIILHTFSDNSASLLFIFNYELCLCDVCFAY